MSTTNTIAKVFETVLSIPGMNDTVKIQLSIDSKKFKDERHLYRNYKDLNDWILNMGQSQKQGLKIKR